MMQFNHRGLYASVRQSYLSTDVILLTELIALMCLWKCRDRIVDVLCILRTLQSTLCCKHNNLLWWGDSEAHVPYLNWQGWWVRATKMYISPIWESETLENVKLIGRSLNTSPIGEHHYQELLEHVITIGKKKTHKDFSLKVEDNSKDLHRSTAKPFGDCWPFCCCSSSRVAAKLLLSALCRNTSSGKRRKGSFSFPPPPTKPLSPPQKKPFTVLSPQVTFLGDQTPGTITLPRSPDAHQHTEQMRRQSWETDRLQSDTSQVWLCGCVPPPPLLFLSCVKCPRGAF